MSLAGWRPVLGNKTSAQPRKTVFHGIHSFTSAQMLEFIAANCDKQLTVDAIAEHVKLNPKLCDGHFSSRDATNHETVYYRNAHQPCAGFAQRYG